MAYHRINWEDAPSDNTLLQAMNLNHMEDGIVANEVAIASLRTSIQTLQNIVSNMGDHQQGEIDGVGGNVQAVSDKVDSILNNYLMDGTFSFQKRTPADRKVLNGTLYGDDPYRFSLKAGGANHYTAAQTSIYLQKGANAKECSAQGSLGGTAEIYIRDMASAASYLLILAAHTVATGAFYGSSMRLITTGASGGSNAPKPNIANLGGGGNAPATVTAYDWNHISIKNGAATRICQFNLIRLM